MHRWIFAALALTACSPETSLESSSAPSLGADRLWLIEDGPEEAIERSMVRGADGAWSEEVGFRGADRPLIPPPGSSERLLAIRVAWAQDASACSVSQLETSLFGAQQGSIASFFQSASYGQLEVSGDVVGTITIERTPFCDPFSWSNAIDEELAKRGVDLGAYTKRMYMLPGSPCPWSGLALLGGDRAWINGGSCHSLPTVAHEFGHNLGMHHSSTEGAEYGDLSDVMGSASGQLRGFNAPHLAQMGWVSNEIALEDGFDDALVSLAEADGPRIVRSEIESEAAIYVSLRSPVHHDVGLDSFYHDRVFVHRAVPGQMRQTVLLAHLGVNETWSDGLTTVTPRAIGRGSAKVSIERGCRAETPTLSSLRVDVTPGGRQVGTMSLTNRDFGACAASSFALTAEASPELTIALVTPDVWVPAGATIEVRVEVHASASAWPGWREVQLAVARGGERPAPAGSMGVYVDAEAPISPSDLVAMTVRGGVELQSWLYADDSGLQGIELERDGVIVQSTRVSTEFGLVKLADSGLRRGVYTYRARAMDAAGQRSDWSAPLVVRTR